MVKARRVDFRQEARALQENDYSNPRRPLFPRPAHRTLVLPLAPGVVSHRTRRDRLNHVAGDASIVRVVPFTRDECPASPTSGLPLTWREYYGFRNAVIGVLRYYGTFGPMGEMPILKIWESSESALECFDGFSSGFCGCRSGRLCQNLFDEPQYPPIIDHQRVGEHPHLNRTSHRQHGTSCRNDHQVETRPDRNKSRLRQNAAIPI